MVLSRLEMEAINYKVIKNSSNKYNNNKNKKNNNNMEKILMKILKFKVQKSMFRNI